MTRTNHSPEFSNSAGSYNHMLFLQSSLDDVLVSIFFYLSQFALLSNPDWVSPTVSLLNIPPEKIGRRLKISIKYAIESLQNFFANTDEDSNRDIKILSLWAITVEIGNDLVSKFSWKHSLLFATLLHGQNSETGTLVLHDAYSPFSLLLTSTFPLPFEDKSFSLYGFNSLSLIHILSLSPPSPFCHREKRF